MIGNKILELRKKNRLSQEELAGKVGVTRQTISKWELNETVPSLNDAIKLSKIFNVTIDEIACNDIKEILIKKISNTEKLAGIILLLFKIIGILLLIGIIVLIFINVPKIFEQKEIKRAGKYKISCTVDNKEYSYYIDYDSEDNVINYSYFYPFDAYKYSEYKKVDKLLEAIRNEYTVKQNGFCMITEVLKEGQFELDALIESLEKTKKITYLVFDPNGKSKSVFDYDFTYTEIMSVSDSKGVKKFFNLLKEAKYAEAYNDMMIGKLIQFYDEKNNVIAEYEGHYIRTKDKIVGLYIEGEKDYPLFKFFN